MGHTPPNLKGYICLVTGASRGIGRGVALGLGQCGATVYITGRTVQTSVATGGDHTFGSLEQTASEITALGGVAIPVAVDHSDDSQVANLFLRIRREQNGRLDVLVNNAFSAVGYLSSHKNRPFWELDVDESPAHVWDIINRVGLRNNFICATLATRMMLECRDELNVSESGAVATENVNPGLIINISSIGGLRYFFNVAYGVGKSALDRMAADMDRELRIRKRNVAVISLWPGLVRTEIFKANSTGELSSFDLERHGESPELTGLVVAALAALPKKDILSRSGRVLLVADTALQFGIRDTHGRWPRSIRSIKYLLEFAGWNRLSCLFSDCLRLPYWILTLFNSKF